MDKLEPLAVSALEAARLLGVSKPTVYQMMNREDFPALNYCTSDQDRTQAGYISQFLLAGAGQGLHLRDLVRITQLSEREVRKQIHAERRKHIPILSNNRDGYFLPSDKTETTACVASLRRRATEILEAANAIEEAAGID